MAVVLVPAARGNVGRPVVEALVTAGREVRAALRQPGHHVVTGAEPVEFDFTEPGTWPAAFAGVGREGASRADPTHRTTGAPP
jgi:uncharacterized protein YbjT (DUF2867 family)